MARFDNAVRLVRQADPTAPAAGIDALFSDASGKLKTTDSGGVDRFITKFQPPGFWNIFGHSYLQYVNGITYQSGRTDQLFMDALGVSFLNRRNRAVPGSSLVQDGRQGGGWARAMQELTRAQRSAPYVPDGGGYLLGWGINDIGHTPGSTQAQIRTMFQNCLRAVVSRCRASVFYDNGFSVGTRTSYGAGFTAQTGNTDHSSSAGTLRRATSTTSATITLTLPSDYAGEPVVTQFIAQPGTAGATMTYSGTAGVTGTLVVSGIVPSSAGTYVPVVRRITGLTAANAGQTIVMTAGSLTTSVLFDGWWLEAKNPPVVLMLNTARLVGGGYGGYANTIGDSDVTALNTAVASVVAEFDQMVQLVDMDGALAQNTARFETAGLHPNELGAAHIVEALKFSLDSIVPTETAYPSVNLSNSAPRAGAIRKPRTSGLWYSVDAQQTTSNITPTAQDLYAAPFVVTEGREQYTRLATRVAVGGTVAGTIRWGIYDDPDWKCYPQCLVAEATAASGAMSLGTTAGMVQNPASGNGAIFWTLDPGMYWLCIKIITAGTSQALECLTGPDQHGIMPTLNPGDLSNMTNPIGWVIGGQGTGALPLVWPSGGFVTGTFPKMGLLVA